jgi:hypothetical protein
MWRQWVSILLSAGYFSSADKLKKLEVKFREENKITAFQESR